MHETIRNLQTQLLENKTKERGNLSRISELEDKLKQANVKELLLKTRIVEASKSGSATSIPDHPSDSNDSDRDVVWVDDGEQNQLTEKPLELIDPKVTTTSPTSDLAKTEHVNDCSHQMIDVNEARLIGLISSFLVVHPFGASLENILTYVQQVSMTMRAKEVEHILRRYNSIFIENEIDSQPNGAESSITAERKWKFGGFDHIKSSAIVIHD